MNAYISTAAPVCFTVGEILAMFDEPGIWTNTPSGDVQVEKAGGVGIGPTLATATSDWGRKFAEMIHRPKGSAT